MTEWFERWFGTEYLELYPHRDERDAREAVDLIASVVRLEGALVLDLACGPGRHASELAARGARVVGIDLSLPLLRRARRDAVTGGLVRGDMRSLPFAAATFDVVVNLFTSFGYFRSDDEHQTVLVEAASLLVPGGTLVMDYLNAAQVRHGLISSETRTVGRHRVEITRRLVDDGHFVEKTMTLDDGREFMERVRLFSADELAALIATAGLRVTERYGDYDGGPPGPDAPRSVLVGRKP